MARGIDLAKTRDMRRKALAKSGLDAREGLRGELERLGLASADATALAARLVGLARELPEAEYRALIQGVVLGHGADQRRERRSTEFHHMLEDFATELKKLDEGLRLLTAYLSRIREQTVVEPARTLH